MPSTSTIKEPLNDQHISNRWECYQEDGYIKSLKQQKIYKTHKRLSLNIITAIRRNS